MSKFSHINIDRLKSPMMSLAVNNVIYKYGDIFYLKTPRKASRHTFEEGHAFALIHIMSHGTDKYLAKFCSECNLGYLLNVGQDIYGISLYSDMIAEYFTRDVPVPKVKPIQPAINIKTVYAPPDGFTKLIQELPVTTALPFKTDAEHIQKFPVTDFVKSPLSTFTLNNGDVYIIGDIVYLKRNLDIFEKSEPFKIIYIQQILFDTIIIKLCSNDNRGAPLGFSDLRGVSINSSHFIWYFTNITDIDAHKGVTETQYNFPDTTHITSPHQQYITWKVEDIVFLTCSVNGFDVGTPFKIITFTYTDNHTDGAVCTVYLCSNNNIGERILADISGLIINAIDMDNFFTKNYNNVQIAMPPSTKPDPIVEYPYTISKSFMFKNKDLKGVTCKKLAVLHGKEFVECSIHIKGNSCDGLGKGGHCILIDSWYLKDNTTEHVKQVTDSSFFEELAKFTA